MEESKFLIGVKRILGNVKFLKTMLYVAIGLLLLGYVINRATVIMTTNVELTTGESNNMWSILNVLNGKNLYTNPENSPYEIYQYAPFSQYVYVGIAKLFSSLDYIDLYKLLRFVNLLFNCMVAYVCYRFIRRHDISIINALVGTFFCMLLLGDMCWYVRPDALSVLFMIAACVTAYYSFSQNRLIFVSALFTAMAFGTKQDAIQLLAIIPVSFFLIKKYCLGLIYLFSALALCAMIFCSLYFYYGEVYIHSIIGGVSITPSVMFAFGVLNRYLQLYNFFPIVMIVASIWSILKLKEQEDVFLALLVIGTFIFAMGTSLKPGGHPGYYTLSNILGTLLMAVLLREMQYKNVISVFSVLWAFYFFSGMVLHYTSRSFDFSCDRYEKAKISAQKLHQVLPKDFKLYTTDIYLKLELAEHTILPNTEFYPESPFNIQKAIEDTFYIYGEIDSDYLISHKLRKDKIHEISVDEMKLYVYGGESKCVINNNIKQ